MNSLFTDATNRPPPVSSLAWWGELWLRGNVAEPKQFSSLPFTNTFTFTFLRAGSFSRGKKIEEKGFFGFFFDFVREYLEKIFREEFLFFFFFGIIRTCLTIEKKFDF